MVRNERLAQMLILLTLVSVSGCQSAPPMPKETFSQAAKLCDLRATTYTFRDGIFLDEPLIDFTKEADPLNARNCFNGALETVDRAKTDRGVDHISYIWEWRG
jgi:hypothetical protein